MNIALCTDENFSIPALVCITSIFENNKNEECHIYILTDGLSSHAKQKFTQLSEYYQQHIDIMSIDKHRFDGLTVNERFPVSMYYRFLLPEMLPNKELILYLDCDIIVRHSLQEIFAVDMTGNAVAAVIAQSCDSLHWTNLLELSTPYFNSGVLLMNLSFWRDHDITGKLIEWIAQNPKKCSLPDQNALNKVLEGAVKYISPTYNYQEKWFKSMRDLLHYSKWEEIREIGKDPTIVHYCEAEKPWFQECKNPYQEDFLLYANLHKFIEFKIRKRYGLMYQCTILVDKIGLKFRYWAEISQKRIIKGIKIS